MMAAGTRAPIPMAANATPTNHEGKLCSNSAGTAKLLPNWCAHVDLMAGKPKGHEVDFILIR
jgi:hypothetical protein